MILYNSTVSGNCYKMRLLLAHLGLEVELRDVDVVSRSRRDFLDGLNPARRVPTLILDDGRPLAESNAILWYFGEGTRFVPEDRYTRAQVLQWMFFEQCDGMTIADISLYAYTHVAHEGGFILDRFPAIRAWLERVATQPGHVPIDA